MQDEMDPFHVHYVATTSRALGAQVAACQEIEA